MAEISLAIIGGSGKFGSWYARFFKERGFDVTITGRDKKKLRKVAGEIRVNWTTDNKKAASKAEVIIVSVLVESTPGVLEEVAPCVRKGAILLDFASVKSAACKTLEKFKHSGIELASVHPMHGPRIAFLRNVPIAFIPIEPGEKYTWLKRLFQREGADVFETNAREHDRIVSVVQGLTHFTAIAYAKAIKEIGLNAGRTLPFSTPTYELMLSCCARVLLQDPGLYASIQTENPLNKNVRRALLESIEKLGFSADSGKTGVLGKEIRKCASIFTGKTKELVLKKSDAAINALLQTRVSEGAAGVKKLAVLGPPATFTDFAAELYSREHGRRSRVYFRNIPEVFEAVEKRVCSEGIVPIENMIEGTIAVTLDNLFTSNLKIKAEILVPVHHSLAVLPGTKLKEVVKVISHPQALAQCKRWLQKNLPNAKLVEAASTAEAMFIVASKKEFGSAAIGSKEAAELNKLDILAQNIEDEAGNVTRFFVIAKEDSKPMGNDRTSIALRAYEDRPGLLHDILKAFSSRGVNLTKIESRPAKKRFGEYVFYIDLEGHRKQREIKEALRSICRLAEAKILGSYPRKF